DKFYNVFNVSIGANGAVLPNFKLAPGRWYEVEFDWDTNQRQCRVSADGRQVGVILDNRRSSGVNYLRLRSIATEPDAGLLVRAVDADVLASWKPLLKDASDPA